MALLQGMFRSTASCLERLANCAAISPALASGHPIVISSWAKSALSSGWLTRHDGPLPSHATRMLVTSTRSIGLLFSPLLLGPTGVSPILPSVSSSPLNWPKAVY